MSKINAIQRFIGEPFSMERAVEYVATHDLTSQRPYLLRSHEQGKYVECSESLHEDLRYDLTHRNVLYYKPIGNAWVFAFQAGTYIRKGQTLFFVESENIALADKTLEEEIYEFLKTKYVRIEDPKQSEEIQRIAFLGEFSWGYHTDRIKHTDKSILLFVPDTYLAYGDPDNDTFALFGVTYSEITYLEIINFYYNYLESIESSSDHSNEQHAQIMKPLTQKIFTISKEKGLSPHSITNNCCLNLTDGSCIIGTSKIDLLNKIMKL